jgi:transcriptional regulator of acetoin/glycerol metabolism
MLVHWFLDRHAKGFAIQVSSAAMKCLLQYDWPGNVRELENCIQRATALGDGERIDVADLPPAGLSGTAVEPLSSLAPPQDSLSSNDLEDIEKATIQRVFQQVKGDKVRAGKMLGISRATLYRKLKRYNIASRTDLPPTSHTLQ